MTAGGLEVEYDGDTINIVNEGKKIKFKKNIEEITFSAKQSRENGQKVIFITERCVFELREDGLILTEIAKGVDVEKDILSVMEFRPQISKDLKFM